MPNEWDVPLPQGKDSPSRRSGQGKRPGRSQRRRQRSVFLYIAVLFCAAFVLLLFTFLMERRQYLQLQAQNQDNIQQSVSAVQSLRGLYDENAKLKDEVSELNSQLEALKSQLSAAEEDRNALQARIEGEEKSVSAMDWFWQIDEAYVRGKYSLCRTLIASLEEAGLQESLPKESITENDRFSPYDRYMEIRGRVVK